MWLRASVIQLLGAYSSEGREFEHTCGLLVNGELLWNCPIESCECRCSNGSFKYN